MDFKQFLTEMIVHPLGMPRHNQIYFVAWRQHLWTGNYQDIENNSTAIYRQIMAEHPRSQQMLDHPYLTKEPTDIVNWVKENLPDAIAGEFNPKTKQISLTGADYSPVTSPLVAKVLQTLRARTLSHEYTDERTQRYGRGQMQGRIPEVLYHGTGTEYFVNIVRLGLMPMGHQSNYSGVFHDEAVFLSATLPEAEMHAFHTSRGSKYQRRQGKGYPMVVAVRLPDPSKLTSDMDADRKAGGNDYDHSYWYDRNDHPDNYSSVNSWKTSKHLGVFGYKGRIPANFIDHIRVFSTYADKWFRITPDKFPTLCDKIERRGEDLWYLYLGEKPGSSY